MSAVPSRASAERPLGALLSHSAIYSAAPILRQVLSVAMTRFYTAWLGPAGAGVKENADLWCIALQQVLGQNVLQAMVRFYYDQKSERGRAAVVSSTTLVVTLGAALVCGLALLAVPWLSPLLLGRGGTVPSSELERVTTLTLLLVPFQLATMSGNYYLFALKRSSTYTILQTAKLLLEVGLNVLLMGWLGYGVTGFLLAMLAGEVLTSLGLCGWMLLGVGARIDRALLRPILAYAGPLVPVGILQLALHQADRRIVLEFLGQEPAGVYGFGYRIASLVTTVVLGPFIVTWQPWIFAVEDEAERGRLVGRVGTYAVLAIAAASLAVMAIGREAALVLGGNPAFHAAWRVVPLVTTGYVLWALYNITQTPLFLAKRTGPLVFVNLAAVLLNVGLNLWWVPRGGVLGAAAATLTTFTVLAGLGMASSRLIAGVSFEFGRLATTLAAVALGGASAYALDARVEADRLDNWLALAAKGLVAAAFALVLWGVVLHRSERARFLAFVRARLVRS
jgi:O-antigen/teichoic acid export membrane protein